MPSRPLPHLLEEACSSAVDSLKRRVAVSTASVVASSYWLSSA